MTSKMDNFYDKCLDIMQTTLSLLEKLVPEPVRVPYKDSFVFRYIEKSLEQALVQKIARLTSGLHAARLLMEHGFVQEQASIQRILDELQEDITFLSLSVIYNNKTSLHQDYLTEFYKDEFESTNINLTSLKRGMVPRKKIRAYIARTGQGFLNMNNTLDSLHAVGDTYSGFIHAFSPHIMDMYFGEPAKFYVQGMLGTDRHNEHRKDLWSYFYRGICALSFTAKAFKNDELFDDLHKFIVKVESAPRTYR